MGSCETVHRPKLGDKPHTALEVLGKGCPYTHCWYIWARLAVLPALGKDQADKAAGTGTTGWAWAPAGPACRAEHYHLLSPFRALPPFCPEGGSMCLPNLSSDGNLHIWAKISQSTGLKCWPPFLDSTSLVQKKSHHTQRSPSATLGPLLKRQCLNSGNWRLSDLTYFEGHRIPPGNTLSATWFD